MATDEIEKVDVIVKDTYTSRKGLTWEKLGESPKEWCPAEIKGFLRGRRGLELPVYHIGSIKVDKVPMTYTVNGVEKQGFGQGIAYINDQKDYKHVDTPHGSQGCELCGHWIIDAHVLINYTRKEWMNVGCECIGNYYGKVVRDRIKVFKLNEIRAEFIHLLPAFMSYLDEQVQDSDYGRRTHRLEYWAWKLRTKYQGIKVEETTSKVLSNRLKEMKKLLNIETKTEVQK
jgi:hypothetical protein